MMDFEKYLVDNRLVPKEKAKYFVNWADKFLHGINYKTTAINMESFSCFINSMQKNPKYADWRLWKVRWTGYSPKDSHHITVMPLFAFN
jgi:hypothetical protein